MGKFNILWIDDQPRKCKRDELILGKFIEQKGLTPHIEFVPKPNKEELLVEGTESNNLLTSRDYDLLLIDYKLMGDLLGDCVISELREKYKIFVDIILYSSAKNEMITAVKNSFDRESSFQYLDNVHIIPLVGDEFQTKTCQIIGKIVSSWYNAHAIRGVVLAKTSKFEDVVSDIIKKNYKDHLIPIKEILMKKGKHVLDSANGNWENVYGAEDPVEYVLDRPVAFNWAVKEEILNYLIDKKVVVIDAQVVTNIKDLFKLRNNFAHNKMKIENGECHLYLKDKVKTYDEEEIMKIRDKIASVERCLEGLMV